MLPESSITNTILGGALVVAKIGISAKGPGAAPVEGPTSIKTKPVVTLIHKDLIKWDISLLLDITP